MDDGHGTIHPGDRGECIHHWLIDEKNFGVCKKCGANKQFQSGSWYDSSIRKNSYNKSSKGQQDSPGTKS